MNLNLVKVKSVLTVPGGLIAIDKKQAARRAHKLTEIEDQPEGLKKGFVLYQLNDETQFKKGEKVYIEEIPKSDNPLLDVVGSVDIGGDEEDDEAKAKADAEAKANADAEAKAKADAKDAKK